MVRSEGLSVISREDKPSGMMYVCTLLLPPSCADTLLALLPQVERLVCDAARTSRDSGSEKWCDRRQALTRARPALQIRKGAAERRSV